MRLEDRKASSEYLDIFLADMQSAQTIEQLGARLKRHMSGLGFDFFSYQMWGPGSGTRASLYISEFGKSWTDRYVEMKYVRDDLVCSHAAISYTPFAWHEITPARFLTSTQTQIFDEAKSAGLKAGGTIPVHGPGGTRALLSVANDQSHLQFGQSFTHMRHLLQIMSIYLHESVVRLGWKKNEPGSFRLTPRELEILTWTADGKTTFEISVILTLSESTVIQHIKNACMKLNTANKTHAVAVALLHGLIRP